MRLTRAGGAVLAVGATLLAVGALARRPVLGVAGIAALVAVATGVVAVLRPVAIRVERVLQPGRVHRLDPAEAVLTLAASARTLPPGLAAEDRVGPDRVAVAVPDDRRPMVVTRYPLPTEARGRQAVGPVVVRRHDRLALVERAVAAGSPAELWVLPRVHRVRPPSAGLVVDLEGPVSDRAIEGTVTFAGIRPYVRGDDLRLVHWRSTARTGELLVRQLVDTVRPELAVVLDTRAVAWPGTTGEVPGRRRPSARHRPPPFEEAVELAASIVQAAHDEGRGVRLLVTGELDATTSVSASAGPLERLALVQPDLAPPAGEASHLDTVATLGRARGAVSTAGLVVVVSGDDPATLAGALVDRRSAPTIVLALGAPRQQTRRGSLLVLAAPDLRQLLATWDDEVAR